MRNNEKMDSPKSDKRKHVTLTLYEKMEIIDLCERRELTKAAIAQTFGIGRSTVTDIYNNRDQIRLFVETHHNEHVVSKRRKLDKFYASSSRIDDSDIPTLKIDDEEEEAIDAIEEYEYQEITDQDYEVVYASTLPVSFSQTESRRQSSTPKEKAPSMSTSFMSSSKRKSKTLTFREKYEIIQQIEAGIAVTTIASSYDVGKTTIYDFLKRKDEIFAYIEKTNDLDRRTFKGSRFPFIEDSAIKWCNNRDTFTKEELLAHVNLIFEDSKVSGQPVPKNGFSKASWSKRFFRRNPNLRCKVVTEDGEPEDFSRETSFNDSSPKLRVDSATRSDNKQRRIVNYVEKMAILNQIDKGKDIEDIAEEFCITREMVEEVESKRQILKNVRTSLKDSDKRRSGKTTSNSMLKLEVELLAWCLEQKSFPIDYEQLAKKAASMHAELAQDSKERDFEPTTNWVKRFVMRNAELRRKQGIVVSQLHEFVLPDQLIEEDLTADETDNSQYEYLDDSEVVEHDPENTEYLEEYIVEEIDAEEPTFADERPHSNFIEVATEEAPKPFNLGISSFIALRSLKTLIKYTKQQGHENMLGHLLDYQDQLEDSEN